MPKKNKTTQTPAQTIVVDVTTDEHKADLAQGLQGDETLQPGRHTFRRGSFLQRHAQSAIGTKIRISINLDADILDHFKARAAQPNAAPYQTQINNALRAVMEQEQTQSTAVHVAYADALLADQNFINAVARRIAEQQVVYQTKE